MTAAIEFFDYELSAEAYKARLLLDILGVAYTTRLVEVYPGCEHDAPWYRAISPRGIVPALRAGDALIDDAEAILVHVARHHDPTGRWYPAGAPEVTRWLAFARELAASAGAARLHDGLLAHGVDVAGCRREALRLLRVLDEHLWFAERDGDRWLVPGDHPTIADLACFPDVMLAEEGRVFLHEHRAIRRWTDRVKAIPGFTPMPGLFPL